MSLLVSFPLPLNVVSTPRAEVTIQVAVKDTGIGIPQERLDRLFKAFSQVDSSTTRQLWWARGWDLAISKRLVETDGEAKYGLKVCMGRVRPFFFTLKTIVAEGTPLRLLRREPSRTNGQTITYC